MKNSLLLASLCCALSLHATTSPTTSQQPTVKTDASAIVASVMLNDAPLKEAVKLISTASHYPIVCTKEAGETLISVNFRNTPFEETLEAMCRAHGLWINRTPGGVMLISTLKQHVAAQSVYSSDAIESVTVKYPSVLDVADTIKGLFRDRIVWERPEEDRLDTRETLDRAISRLDLITQRSQFDMLSNTSSSSSSSSSSSNRESVTDTTSEQISSLNESQEASSQAILRASETGEASKTTSLVYISTMPEVNTILIRSADKDAVAAVKAAVQAIDKPRGQVLLQVSILAVDISNLKESGVEWLFGETKQLSGGFADSLIQSITKAPTAYTTGTPTFGYVSDRFQARLKLLAKDENVKELSTPTLLVADNEAANVFVGSSSKMVDEIIPGKETITDGGTISKTDPTIKLETRNIGVSLLIMPRVHADSSVTLRIMQERSEKSLKDNTIEYQGETLLVTNDIDQQLVSSTLVADDKALLYLGGMIKESDVDSEYGIPVIKDIPYLGRLFKIKSTNKKREELIVLIRPHVIAVPGQAADASLKALTRTSLNVSALLSEDPKALGCIIKEPAAPSKQ